MMAAKGTGDERPSAVAMLSFPTGLQGLPTVPASDPRYQPGGDGRIIFIQ